MTQKYPSQKHPLALLYGFGAGILNGLFGCGGGVLLLLVLRKKNAPSEAAGAAEAGKKAYVTALMCTLPLSLISLCLLLLNGRGDTLPSFSRMVPLLVGGLGGGLSAGLLFRRTPPGALTYLFAALTVFAGIRMMGG